MYCTATTLVPYPYLNQQDCMQTLTFETKNCQGKFRKEISCKCGPHLSSTYRYCNTERKLCFMIFLNHALLKQIPCKTVSYNTRVYTSSLTTLLCKN